MSIEMSLHDKIQEAWNTKTSLEFKGWVGIDNLSPAIIAYGQLWQVTLHHNNCKLGCNGKCIISASDLVKARSADIFRGMPDLHPNEEAVIWDLAFKIHKNHSNRGAITPTWALLDNSTKCDCFEMAIRQIDREKQKLLLDNLPKIDSEDLHWIERFE